nr:hypothetical protein [Treponema sp.]
IKMAYKRANCDIKDKPFLTIGEAADFFNIGPAKIDYLVHQPDCDFVLYNGKKKLIIKEAFLKYLMNSKQI